MDNKVAQPSWLLGHGQAPPTAHMPLDRIPLSQFLLKLFPGFPGSITRFFHWFSGKPAGSIGFFRFDCSNNPPGFKNRSDRWFQFFPVRPPVIFDRHHLHKKTSRCYPTYRIRYQATPLPSRSNYLLEPLHPYPMILEPKSVGVSE